MQIPQDHSISTVFRCDYPIITKTWFNNVTDVIQHHVFTQIIIRDRIDLASKNPLRFTIYCDRERKIPDARKQINHGFIHMSNRRHPTPLLYVP